MSIASVHDISWRKVLLLIVDDLVNNACSLMIEESLLIEEKQKHNDLVV